MTTTLERPQAKAVEAGAFAPRQLWASLPDALRKLAPRAQLRNPVMFVVWVGSVLVTISAIAEPSVFAVLIAVWLWFTVLFANLAEAVAEGRGKAQAESLRRTKKETVARKLVDGTETRVGGTELTVGDLVVVEAGETIPGDGDVVEGIATVDESAITGESAPVVREAGGDRSSVTGGTTVLSDRIVVKITTRPIIRSRNVSPGLAVISTTIRSDRTRVPPVTLERSPPDSRMTGADSPVIADSSTEAMPSTTVPSPGITSPAWTITVSPRCNCEAATARPSTSRAVVSARMARSEAACARPRPSASASARLANTTVSHSQTVTVNVNHEGSFPPPSGWPPNSWISHAIVVISAPTSTTNMTGLRTCTRGSSFLKEAAIAGHRISGVNRDLPARGAPVGAGAGGVWVAVIGRVPR